PLQHAPDCTVRVPGSKSITNRALLIAALADGVSMLDGALYSDDTTYMAESWRRLGVRVDEDVAGRRFQVYGCGGAIPANNAELFAGNAGTAMRFLVAALCLGHGHFRIDGTPRMRERPIQDLVDTLRHLGARLRCLSPRGGPPVEVDADGLCGGTATIDAAKSSQFLSAVLQVAPYTRQGVQLEVSERLVAAPYIDMTIAVMAAFGVSLERQGYRRFTVAPQTYRGRDYRIEPDASSAHYFLAAAAITGGRVRIDGLGKNSLQGDIRFADVLETMGATVTRGDDFLEVRGRGELGGIDIDMNEISDTAPTLAAIAPFAKGPVTIRNVAHLRLQESDRLLAVATELERLGVSVQQRDDGLTIKPSSIRAAAVETYDDHRMAMSFALIGLRVPGIGIRDPQCVRKTFPDYFALLEELRR
ncbi:MAG TPA: 3-phosphoshikimate 1-carboxyvinyltransferase, partial [Candidatus Acidoferrales bacterium]|nr:3-phosphoshikimate 1-carboxyvinyltransferase [Candidatus Acidoferrales bacterium]